MNLSASPLRANGSRVPVSSSFEDNRMVAGMRLLLACAGLAIILLDPTEPDRRVGVTYAALVLYVLFSAAFYAAIAARFEAGRRLASWAHWQDVAWFTLLIALSSGTNSIFFFGYYFPILVASFRWGCASGMRTAVISTALFLTVGYATTSGVPGFELNRFLLRPAYLLILGYMVARWGGREMQHRRRLALLHAVSSMSNPRLGVSRTVGRLLEQVRDFYGAGGCILVARAPAAPGFVIMRAEAGGSAPERFQSLAPELAHRLLDPLADCSVVHRRPSGRGPFSRGHHFSAEHGRGSFAAGLRRAASAVADVLDARSFVSIPLFSEGELLGRVFVVSARRAFQDSDAAFLAQLADQAATVVENIRLLEGMAVGAAEDERKRIAHDLHDSIIQSYIGIQLGLAGVKQLCEQNGSAMAAAEIEGLVAMAESGAEGARRYVFRLRSGGEADGTLAAALRRYAARFSEASRIAVEVEISEDLRLSDRLAAEVFQMAVEALSNVRRHTAAARANVRVERLDGQLLLRVENETNGGGPFVPFRPKSIASRAEALGGVARVDVTKHGWTIVEVEIPL